MRRPSLYAAIVTALFASSSACGSSRTEGGPEGGSVIVGQGADAGALLPPFAADVSGRVASELLFDPLAELGGSLNVVGDSAFAPRLASRWRWSLDSLVITFELRPDARWHDGRPVQAADVVFAYRTIRDPANASHLVSGLGGIDSVVAVDSLTASVFFSQRHAEQFYQATRIIPLPEHRLGGIAAGEALRTAAEALAPIGSGRYRFVAWERDVRLELRAVDDHYRGRAKLDRVLFAISKDTDAGLAQVWAGETDVWEPLSPGQFAEAAAHPTVRLVAGPGYDYTFLNFNLRDARDRSRPHALFADRSLRRALTMAVDRNAVRQAALDSLGANGLGPFVRAQATADTTIEQIPFDRNAAEAAFDSLGWTGRGIDGIRTRGRARLAFSITVPTTSRPRMRSAVVIQEQLRQVGVEVTVRALDFQAMRAEVDARRFDAVLWTWRTTPSPSNLRGSWASAAIPDGGAQNFGSYESRAFDRAVLDGLEAMDLATRRASLRRAYQQIVDDAPAIWLFEVRNLAAVHPRLRLPAWRSDAWWLTLGEWTVDPAQALPRDARPSAP